MKSDFVETDHHMASGDPHQDLVQLARQKDFVGFRSFLSNFYQQALAQGKSPADAQDDLHQVLMDAAAAHDKDTAGHIRRVAVLAGFIAHKAGESPEFCLELIQAAPLHDIGKMATPDHVLKKNAGFTDSEWRVMRRHAGHGYQMLNGVDGFEMAAEIALHHHQRYDGKGYPGRRPGHQISKAVWYFTPVDVYEALRSERPYKPPFTHDRAIHILLHGDEEGRIKPAHFHPKALEMIDRHQNDIEQIYLAMTVQNMSEPETEFGRTIVNWRQTRSQQSLTHTRSLGIAS